MSGSAESFATPLGAASVILLRPRAGSCELEVFLLCRHRKASFMSSAYVFPGGGAEEGEDPRATAARELFEEAGILLADAPVARDVRARWRRAVNDSNAVLATLMSDHGVNFDLAALHYFAHWITPSVERKRFSARFFVAFLPEGQTPSFDNVETVDQVWVTPAEALARAGELRLPPPQVRTFMELRDAADRGADAVVEACAERAQHAHPIMPRLRTLDGGGFALLLPWDPEYATEGTGDRCEMPPGHLLAVGPSRFVLEDKTWNNIHAPTSQTAD